MLRGSSRELCGRPGPTRAVASSTTITRSTSDSADPTCSFRRSPRAERGLCRPGVSTKTAWIPGRWSTARTALLVVERAGRGDRHLRPDDAVHEGRLADVRPADDSDEPGAELRGRVFGDDAFELDPVVTTQAGSCPATGSLRPRPAHAQRPGPPSPVRSGSPPRVRPPAGARRRPPTRLARGHGRADRR